MNGRSKHPPVAAPAAVAVRSKARARRPRARASLRGAVKEVVRRAILDAAERVFGARGFEAARMAEIAQQAGVAAGTLYNYFDSKDRIFRALIEHRGEEIAGRLEAVAARVNGARERLVALTEATFQYIESHAEMFQLFEQLGAHPAGAGRSACGPGADRVRQRYLRVHREAFAAAARQGAIRDRGFGPDELAVIYAGGLQGLLRHWLRAGRKGPRLTERARSLVDLFLEGATRKP